jgi:hypothetical protein
MLEEGCRSREKIGKLPAWVRPEPAREPYKALTLPGNQCALRQFPLEEIRTASDRDIH